MHETLIESGPLLVAISIPGSGEDDMAACRLEGLVRAALGLRELEPERILGRRQFAWYIAAEKPNGSGEDRSAFAICYPHEAETPAAADFTSRALTVPAGEAYHPIHTSFRRALVRGRAASAVAALVVLF